MSLDYYHQRNKVADTFALVQYLVDNAEAKNLTVCLPSSGKTLLPQDMYLLPLAVAESVHASEAIIIKETTKISSFVPRSDDPSDGYMPMKLIAAGMIEDDFTDFLPRDQVKASFEPASPNKPRVPIKDYSYVDADRILRDLF